MAFLADPNTWVAVAFVIFIGILVYVGAFRAIAKSLDARAARIEAELEEARKLKAEAAQVLADYQRKRQEAEAEAQSIIAAANDEAGRIAVEAKAKIEEFVTRRTKMAETKIAQAEAQATADVRAAAADAAISASEKILSAQSKGQMADDLVAKGIDDVRKKLN